MMLASVARRRLAFVPTRAAVVRSLSTKEVQEGAASEEATPIGDDGRHELWREGIYDHDNEPK